MLLKGKKFVSKKLTQIVDVMEKYSEDKLNQRAGDISLPAFLKASIYKSVAKFITRQQIKSLMKQYDKINDKKDEYTQDLADGIISQKQYERKMEQVQYAMDKNDYTHYVDRDDATAKPKSPRWERFKTNVKNVVLAPVHFGKWVGEKVGNVFGKGKVAALTAGKVISNVATNVKQQIEPVKQQITETEKTKKHMKTVEKSKEWDDQATIVEKRRAFDESSKATQEHVFNKEYAAALKENAKRGFEAPKYAESIQRPEEEQENIKTDVDREVEDVRSYRKLDDRQEAYEVASIEAQQQIMSEDTEAAFAENEARENKIKENFITKKEIFATRSQEKQEEMLNRDFKRATKENEKYNREKARREALHMDENAPDIDHKAAIEKVEGEVLTPEEVKQVYDDKNQGR